MKNKRTFPLYTTVSLIAAGLWLLLLGIMVLLSKTNTHLYLLGISTPELVVLCLFLFGTSLLSGLVVWACQKIRRRSIPAIFGSIATVIYLYCLFTLFVLISGNPYFNFSSPDGRHQIVIREETFLANGGGPIFEKTAFFTMTQIGAYGVPDADRPFSDDNYRFIWQETGFELRYMFRNPHLLEEGEAGYQSVTVNYAQ